MWFIKSILHILHASSYFLLYHCFFIYAIKDGTGLDHNHYTIKDTAISNENYENKQYNGHGCLDCTNLMNFIRYSLSMIEDKKVISIDKEDKNYICWKHGRGIGIHLTPTTAGTKENKTPYYCQPSSSSDDYVLQRHPLDCSKYSICTNNILYSINCECDDGYEFNIQYKYCRPIHEVLDCPRIIKTTIDISNKCNTNGIGFINPHISDCTKYYTCVQLGNEQMLILEYQCPNYHGFDPIQGTCKENYCDKKYPNNSWDNEWNQQIYTYKDYKYKNNIVPTSPDKFFQNQNPSAYYYTSNPNNEYNQINYSNNYYRCLEQIPDKNEECVYPGFFKIENDCTSYIICIGGPHDKHLAYKAKCPDGKTFSRSYRRCVSYELQDCGNKNEWSGGHLNENYFSQSSTEENELKLPLGDMSVQDIQIFNHTDVFKLPCTQDVNISSANNQSELVANTTLVLSLPKNLNLNSTPGNTSGNPLSEVISLDPPLTGITDSLPLNDSFSPKPDIIHVLVFDNNETIEIVPELSNENISHILLPTLQNPTDENNSSTTNITEIHIVGSNDNTRRNNVTSEKGTLLESINDGKILLNETSVVLQDKECSDTVLEDFIIKNVSNLHNLSLEPSNLELYSKNLAADEILDSELEILDIVLNSLINLSCETFPVDKDTMLGTLPLEDINKTYALSPSVVNFETIPEKDLLLDKVSTNFENIVDLLTVLENIMKSLVSRDNVLTDLSALKDLEVIILSILSILQESGSTYNQTLPIKNETLPIVNIIYPPDKNKSNKETISETPKYLTGLENGQFVSDETFPVRENEHGKIENTGESLPLQVVDEITLDSATDTTPEGSVSEILKVDQSKITDTTPEGPLSEILKVNQSKITDTTPEGPVSEILKVDQSKITDTTPEGPVSEILKVDPSKITYTTPEGPVSEILKVDPSKITDTTPEGPVSKILKVDLSKITDTTPEDPVSKILKVHPSKITDTTPEGPVSEILKFDLSKITDTTSEDPVSEILKVDAPLSGITDSLSPDSYPSEEVADRNGLPLPVTDVIKLDSAKYPISNGPVPEILNAGTALTGITNSLSPDSYPSEEAADRNGLPLSVTDVIKLDSAKDPISNTPVSEILNADTPLSGITDSLSPESYLPEGTADRNRLPLPVTDVIKLDSAKDPISNGPVPKILNADTPLSGITDSLSPDSYPSEQAADRNGLPLSVTDVIKLDSAKDPISNGPVPEILNAGTLISGITDPLSPDSYPSEEASDRNRLPLPVTDVIKLDSAKDPISNGPVPEILNAGTPLSGITDPLSPESYPFEEAADRNGLPLPVTDVIKLDSAKDPISNGPVPEILNAGTPLSGITDSLSPDSYPSEEAADRNGLPLSVTDVIKLNSAKDPISNGPVPEILNADTPLSGITDSLSPDSYPSEEAADRNGLPLSVTDVIKLDSAKDPISNGPVPEILNAGTPLSGITDSLSPDSYPSEEAADRNGLPLSVTDVIKLDSAKDPISNGPVPEILNADTPLSGITDSLSPDSYPSEEAADRNGLPLLVTDVIKLDSAKDLISNTPVSEILNAGTPLSGITDSLSPDSYLSEEAADRNRLPLPVTDVIKLDSAKDPISNGLVPEILNAGTPLSGITDPLSPDSYPSEEAADRNGLPLSVTDVIKLDSAKDPISNGPVPEILNADTPLSGITDSLSPDSYPSEEAADRNGLPLSVTDVIKLDSAKDPISNGPVPEILNAGTPLSGITDSLSPDSYPSEEALDRNGLPLSVTDVMKLDSAKDPISNGPVPEILNADTPLSGITDSLSPDSYPSEEAADRNGLPLSVTDVIKLDSAKDPIFNTPVSEILNAGTPLSGITDSLSPDSYLSEEAADRNRLPLPVTDVIKLDSAKDPISNGPVPEILNAGTPLSGITDPLSPDSYPSEEAADRNGLPLPVTDVIKLDSAKDPISNAPVSEILNAGTPLSGITDSLSPDSYPSEEAVDRNRLPLPVTDVIKLDSAKDPISNGPVPEILNAGTPLSGITDPLSPDSYPSEEASDRNRLPLPVTDVIKLDSAKDPISNGPVPEILNAGTPLIGITDSPLPGKNPSEWTTDPIGLPLQAASDINLGSVTDPISSPPAVSEIVKVDTPLNGITDSLFSGKNPSEWAAVPNGLPLPAGDDIKLNSKTDPVSEVPKSEILKVDAPLRGITDSLLPDKIQSRPDMSVLSIDSKSEDTNLPVDKTPQLPVRNILKLENPDLLGGINTGQNMKTNNNGGGYEHEMIESGDSRESESLMISSSENYEQPGLLGGLGLG